MVRLTEHRFTVAAFNVVQHVNNKSFKVVCHPIVALESAEDYLYSCLPEVRQHLQSRSRMSN